MDQDQTDDSIFCFFDANEDYSITIYLATIPLYFCIVAALCWVRIRHRKSDFFKKSKKQVKYIFTLVFIWAFLLGATLFINVAVYYIFINQPAPTEMSFTQKVLSILYILFSAMSGFMVQTVMIEIPHIWIQNTMKIIELKQNQGLIQLKADNRKFLHLNFKITSLISGYRWVRVAIFFYFIAAPLLAIVVKKQQFMAASYVLLCVDCIVIFLIYVRGFIFLRKLKWAIPFTIKQIIIEYAILEVVCLIRIANNFLVRFIILKNDSITIQSNCHNTTEDTIWLINYNVLLAFSVLVMHFTPICCVLYIYWPVRKESVDTLISSRNSNSSFYFSS